MFDNIKKSTDWNIDGLMLWGYFFTDPSAEKLQSLKSKLPGDCYSFVDLFVPELENDEDEYYFLHVERIESHTVLSLHSRNLEFYALADQLGIDTYDGMDVGPSPNS